MAGPDDFRRVALSFPGAVEKAHMNHPDFRVDGKIFASLGSPSYGWGMVKLKPDEQDVLVLLGKGVFRPAAGAWGRSGSTLVQLDEVSDDLLYMGISMAWHNRAPAKLKAPANPGL
jgi:hypothetical protein